jgi:FtsP/CotA-like multicopper oxidase with cupredoxin domain
MQAIAIMLALILVTGSAYSMFILGGEANAQQQQPKHEIGQPDYLKQFNSGIANNLTNGTTVRNFTLLTEETHQVPISTGNNSMDQIVFPGWTYNGTIPGPTMRMTEGDHVFITVINSPESKQHHSLHMHSIHSPSMDGTFGASGDIPPGERFTYQFVAGPVGLYPYHCHVAPILDHINRGLYGAMIIDPKEPRPAANEMMMMMNSYDLDLNEDMSPTFRVPTAAEANQIMYPDEDLTPEEQEEARPKLEVDRGNEIYTINGKANQYMNDPIELVKGEPVRIYLLSMTEFDPVNSFHLHSGMFNFTASGTMTTPPTLTDVVTLAQGDRGIIEFTPHQTGHMMIHAHVNEFTDLGWMGAFDVKSP